MWNSARCVAHAGFRNVGWPQEPSRPVRVLADDLLVQLFGARTHSTGLEVHFLNWSDAHRDQVFQSPVDVNQTDTQRSRSVRLMKRARNRFVDSSEGFVELPSFQCDVDFDAVKRVFVVIVCSDA